ncbi:prenyltransferase/squalene oxidase repeat-containing protein [Streptomyces longispororuber]|uniref:prenyltransferase/squalene oxidase repeat-containing protein n=1 Tax=Streptomyces longispororuber TaxID=68230 RepID=UPI00210E99E4|nr:prenyltransferase/squalene oxidase repeat-containing protein [Streptomyces longispororuber]MCQ4207170.1 terpene cyclase/mutase family protein [Streptomyces longispororuber]
MNIRRSAALVAATVVIGAAAAPVAAADSASPSPKVVVPSGLYGTTDPTYDGVWRQSLAFVAQDTVGVRPAGKAVDWLAGQQCEDGGFAAFRAEPGKACDKKTVVDSNSTAAAVQALVAVGGRDGEVAKGVAWLKKNQNADGGWGYNPGGASDANSTSVVLGALAAAGEKPADVTSGPGKSGIDALAALALPCSAGKSGGALAYQPDKKGELTANADATAAGVLGALGTGFAPGKGTAPDAYTCEKDGSSAEALAHNGAVYLQNQLSTHLYLKSQLAGAEDQPDYGNTADAVTAVAAAEGIKYTKDPYAWLEKNAQAWAEQSGPAAYAQLVFAAHATGNDPRDFGGTDLVKALNKTGPAPASASSGDSDEDKKKDDDGSGVSWWIVGVMFIAAVGVGIMLSGRKKKQS